MFLFLGRRIHSGGRGMVGSIASQTRSLSRCPVGDAAAHASSRNPSFYNMFLNVATSAPTVNAVQTVAPLPPSGNFQGNQILPFLQSVGAVDTTGINPGKRNHTTVAPNFHNPYSEQWNLGIQHSINSRIVAEVRYVGNHAVGLFQSVNGNPALQALVDGGFSNLIPRA